MKEFLKNSNFNVFLLENYEKNILNIMKFLKENNSKVCHVLLRTPYDYFISNLKENNITSNHFFFIDVLSSHYKVQKEKKNCLFLNYPNINQILEATKTLIDKNGCEYILFDSISSLLNYHPRFEIQKLVNKLKYEPFNKSKIMFLMPKTEELIIEDSKNLLKDLELFVDTIKELS